MPSSSNKAAATVTQTVTPVPVRLSHGFTLATDETSGIRRYAFLLELDFEEGTAEAVKEEAASKVRRPILQGMCKYFHSLWEDHLLSRKVDERAEAAGWEDLVNVALTHISHSVKGVSVSSLLMNESTARSLLEERKYTLKTLIHPSSKPTEDTHWTRAKAAVKQNLDIADLEVWHQLYSNSSETSSYWLGEWPKE